LIAICYYIGVRQNHGTFTWRQSALLLILFVLALNAKEMAAVLPAVFVVFDWIFLSPKTSSVRERTRWMLQHCRLAAVLALVSVGAAIGKSGAGGPFVNPDYAMSFTLQRFFLNAKVIYSELFYLQFMALNGRKVVLLWLAIFAIAALSKRKSLWF